MDFQAVCRVEDRKVITEVSVPDANEYTRYAYYLYSKEEGVIEKQGYLKEATFAFVPPKTGNYYVRAFVEYKENAEEESRRTAKNTNEVLFYATKSIAYRSLGREMFKPEEPTVYEILWDGVKFELLIRYKPGSNQAVVLGTGDVGGRKRSYPVFDRNAWRDELGCSGIWYFDPSIYRGEATLCWGYGTNDRWYLENIACLVKHILDKWGVTMENSVFFGSSGGGYMSVALATLLRGKAAVINAQLMVENFWPRLVERFKDACLKPGEELLAERTDAVKLFRREGYVPSVRILQNSWAERDMETQLTPFLLALSQAQVDCNDRIALDLYSAEGGHSGMPSKEDSLRLLREELARPLPAGNGIAAQPGGGQTFLERLAAGAFASHQKKQEPWTPENDKKLYLVITVDTEDKYTGVPNLFECDFGEEGNCGVNYIMDQLEQRGMRGVFFTNIYEHLNFKGEYEGYVEGLVRRIADRGHEVALHTHENRWLSFYQNPLYSYSEQEQRRLIQYGTDFIEKHAGKRPVSYRSGSYQCNESTFQALSEMGYRVDSTCYYKSKAGSGNRNRYYRSLNQVTQIEELLEFPVINTRDDKGEEKKFDLNAMDEDGLVAVVEEMKRRPYFNAAQIMFHSFSFLDQKGEPGKEPKFVAGTHAGYGISRALTQRFERFLDYLRDDPDIEVVTFEQYLEKRVKIPPMWGDGIFHTKSEKSRAAALAFKGVRDNPRHQLPDVYPEDGGQDSKCDFDSCFLPKPILYFQERETERYANELMNGRLWVYPRIEAMPYTLDTLDFGVRFSGIPNTFQLYLQALNPVQILTMAFERTRNPAYLEFADRFIRAWSQYAADPARCKASPYVWNDHAVALRAENLMYFGQVCSSVGIWADSLYDRLYDMLEAHGQWLDNDDHYTKRHNHGVIQDQALIHLGYVLKRQEWIDHAKVRLLEQEAWCFNEEMVHTENSPGYAGGVASLFRKIGTFLTANQNPDGEKFTQDMRLVQGYIDWTVKPNGIAAQVGDTSNSPGVLYRSEQNMARKTEEIHKIYPLAGYYFYRSHQDQEPKLDTWKMLKSGYVRMTHKHADDCSFMLYSKGYEIFADSGIYGYVKNDFRTYFTSAMAHNTVVVDDASWPCDMDSQPLVGMSGYRFFPAYDHIRVFNNAYPGVAFQRDFCSADDLTILLDTLSAQEGHTYSQLFHLAEQMEVLEATDRQVLLKLADSGYVVRLRQFGGPVKLSVLRGDLNTPGYGLISRGENHLDVTTTLKFDMTGKDAVFATAITIEDGAGMVRTLSGNKPADALRYDAENKRFTLEELEISCGQGLPEEG